jgi:RimJ/RimL family protein N-acetyltransferase
VDVYLETERLILRRFTPDDLGAIVALDADPAVMRYITGGQPPLPDDQPDLCLAYWLELYERGDAWGFWAAIERSSGAFVGWFHLRPNEEDPPDEPELGYRLARSVWGRGYGTEGSIALVDKAFREHGAGRVYAQTMLANRASWRVMEKAGLRHVRTYHIDWPYRIEGEELGDVEYAITHDEWSSSRSATARAFESAAAEG